MAGIGIADEAKGLRIGGLGSVWSGGNRGLRIGGVHGKELGSLIRQTSLYLIPRFLNFRRSLAWTVEKAPQRGQKAPCP